MKVQEKEKEMEAHSIKGEKTHSVDNVCFSYFVKPSFIFSSASYNRDMLRPGLIICY